MSRAEPLNQWETPLWVARDAIHSNFAGLVEP